MFPSILRFDFDLILGSFLLLGALMGSFWGLGKVQNCFGVYSCSWTILVLYVFVNSDIWFWLHVVTWLWIFPINVWNLLQLNLIWLTSCESSNIGGNWWSCMRSVIKAYRWEVWTSCWIKLTIQSSTEWEQFQEEEMRIEVSSGQNGRNGEALWWLKSGTGDNARIEKKTLAY